MVSSAEKHAEDSSPTYLPDWELPPNFTEQGRRRGGGLSIGKPFKFLIPDMWTNWSGSHSTDSSAYHTAQSSQTAPPSHPPNGSEQLPENQILPATQGEAGSPNEQGTAGPQQKRTIIGIERRRFLRVALFLFGLTVVAIALGVGLGLGLRNKRFLPLPNNTRTFTGDLTYYEPGLGACGVVSSDNSAIVSISHFLFDSKQTGSDPNQNPLCFMKIRTQRFDISLNILKSADLTVVDRCTGCSPTDLDVSPGAFGQLASLTQGRVDVTWAWLSPIPTT